MAEPRGQPEMVELPAAVSIPGVVGAAQPTPTQSAASREQQQQEDTTTASTSQAAVIQTTELATLSDIPMHPLSDQNDRSDTSTGNDSATIRGADIPLGNNAAKTRAIQIDDARASTTPEQAQFTDKPQSNNIASPLEAASPLAIKSPAHHAGSNLDDQVTLELVGCPLART
jgi:hypothetical protein